MAIAHTAFELYAHPRGTRHVSRLGSRGASQQTELPATSCSLGTRAELSCSLCVSRSPENVLFTLHPTRHQLFIFVFQSRIGAPALPDTSSGDTRTPQRPLLYNTQCITRHSRPGGHARCPRRSGSLWDEGLDDALELVWWQTLQLREEGGGVAGCVGGGGLAARPGA